MTVYYPPRICGDIMPEKSTVIDGKLITNPIGEKIEDEYIHIYPGTRMSIKLARSFGDELSDLGYKGVERTDDRTKPIDLPVNIILADDELMLSFYSHNFPEKMPSRLHNFVIDNIPNHVEDILRTKIDVVSRVKSNDQSIAIGETAQVIHFIFNLKNLEKLGRKENSLDEWFE
jgi:hypothetical protein